MPRSGSAKRRKNLVVVASVGREPSRRAEVRQAVREALEGTNYRADLRLPVGREGVLEALPGAEVFFGFRLDDPMLEAGSDLTWVHLGVSGVDSILPPLASREGLVVTNSRGLHGAYMTEYVLGVILAQSKALFRGRDHQRERDWAPRELLPRIRSVEGGTLGILGLGSVGRHLAPRAQALGMRVIGTKRTALQGAPPHGVDEVFPTSQTDEVLRAADWLVLLLPLTKETRSYLNRARIGRLKKGAYVINVGRGELVDEKALLTAIRKGKLSGATLDVFREEPLPETSDLWAEPDVLVTPHVAGNFPEYIEQAARMFGENLALYARRAPLRNRVDVELGY